MSKALQWIYDHPVVAWSAVVIYAVVVTLPHVAVQDWLAVALKPIGMDAFYWSMAIGAVLAAALLSSIYHKAIATHPARRDLLIGWAVTLVLSAVAWRYLSVNNSELIHFAQYAIPGLVLIALTRSVTDALAWIVIMAGIDEGYQFWGLHWDWGNPWDFNDIYLDLLGGAFGILFGMGFLPITTDPKPNWLRPGIFTLSVILLVGAFLWSFGLLLVYEDKSNTHYWFALSRSVHRGFWFYDITWGPRTIHSIQPGEGILVHLITIAAYAVYDVRYRIAAK